MKENKIKFAVVGCGHIGKRHAEMVTRDPDAELVALCDIRPREELGIGVCCSFFCRFAGAVAEWYSYRCR